MIQAIRTNGFGEIIDIERNVAKSLTLNNTYCPAVVKTVFSLKTEKAENVLDDSGNVVQEVALDNSGNPRVDAGGNTIKRNKRNSVKLDAPVLTTTCFFDDGTSVTVRNSPHDKIETKVVWLDENGDITQDESKKKAETTVATDCAKERGICYAIVKRMCSTFNSSGQHVSSNVNRLFTELLKTGEDRVLIDTKAKIVKAAKKARFEARKATAAEKKPAPKRYSRAQIIDLLGAFLEKTVSDEDMLQRLKASLTSRD